MWELQALVCLQAECRRGAGNMSPFLSLLHLKHCDVRPSSRESSPASPLLLALAISHPSPWKASNARRRHSHLTLWEPETEMPTVQCPLTTPPLKPGPSTCTPASFWKLRPVREECVPVPVPVLPHPSSIWVEAIKMQIEAVPVDAPWFPSLLTCFLGRALGRFVLVHCWRRMPRWQSSAKPA